jgi:hypothetical protein
MIIKAFPSHKSIFSTYHEEYSGSELFNIVHWFDLSENTIWLKIINQEEDKTYLNIKLPFSLIQNHLNFADQTMWGILDNATEMALSSDTSTPYVLTENDINSIFDKSINQKEVGLKNLKNDQTPFRLFVPSVNSSLQDCVFLIRNNSEELPQGLEEYNHDINVSFAGPSGQGSVVENISSWKDVISEITIISSEAENSTITVQIETEDKTISEVYLEPIYGLALSTRVNLNNGVGSFGVLTVGLPSGSNVRVKLGYKFFTGVAEFTTTV